MTTKYGWTAVRTPPRSTGAGRRLLTFPSQLPGQPIDQPDRDGPEPGLDQPGPQRVVAEDRPAGRQEEG